MCHCIFITPRTQTDVVSSISKRVSWGHENEEETKQGGQEWGGVSSGAAFSAPSLAQQSALGFSSSLQPTVERSCSRLSKRREEKRDRLGLCEHILTTLTPTGDRRKLQVRGKQEVLREVDVR